MNRKKILCLTISAVIGSFALVSLGVMIYKNNSYKDCWLEGTVVNGIDVSGQTVKESLEIVENRIQNFTLTIKARGNAYLIIRGDDIDYSLKTEPDWKEFFEEQHKKFFLLHNGNEFLIDFDIYYNKLKLKRLISQSQLVKGSKNYKIQEPISAHAEYDKDKKQYICVKEVSGNKINMEMLGEVIEKALKQAKTEIDITDKKMYPEIYQKPKVTSESLELKQEIALCNNAVLRFITFRVAKGVKETITPEQISKWITFKGGKIRYKDKAIKAWVNKFCAKYTTVGKTRTIKSHTGKKVKVYGGDYGWLVDNAKTLKQVQSALRSKISQTLTTKYISNPSTVNKKALSIKKKVAYLNTAYKSGFGKNIKDWDEKNYTEISLSEQKVYVFREGKVVFSCRCITGLPVEKRITRTGAFYIKEHRDEYTMTGDDYSTHVKFWVRITWSGTGFHPATWQPWSRWSKILYKTKGSHGCINLSSSDAEKIYHMVAYREAVFIHS